jgi:predicted enzyme related to lactoylglutathione lyase
MRFFRYILLIQLALGTTALAQTNTMPVLPPITAPASGEHLPGKFVWADLFSSDTETSRTFYEKVFGWEWRQVKPAPQPYGMFYLDGEPVAGLAHREAPDGGDTYGRWIHYISVNDVGTTETAITRHGGRIILPRRNYADRGDFAIVTDAQQAPFGIIHASSGDPGDYRAAHGEWIWRELFTRDLGASIRFYTELFGYAAEKEDEYPKIVEYMLESNGYLRAGIGQLPPESDTAPTWLGYVRVGDVMATLQRALANGGKVLVEPQPEIADGKLAIIADPTGATVGLLFWEYEDASKREEQP